MKGSASIVGLHNVNTYTMTYLKIIKMASLQKTRTESQYIHYVIIQLTTNLKGPSCFGLAVGPFLGFKAPPLGASFDIKCFTGSARGLSDFLGRTGEANNGCWTAFPSSIPESITGCTECSKKR